MTSASIAVLEDRGVIAVTGADAVKLLQGILTNDLDDLDEQPSIAAGLLTPQGKILFEMIVYRAGDGLLIETAVEKVADLVKRLGFYKLRANASIMDVSREWVVTAAWNGAVAWPHGSVGGRDPRLADFGERRIVPVRAREALGANTPAAAYHARRVALGVPEGGADYVIGDTFPHEANFDLRGGVSFTKGCYVGQEVVARMHHKTVIRKRIVRIRGEAPLTSGADVTAGQFVIGRIGTVDGAGGLAFVKLDRAGELAAKGEKLRAGEVPVAIDQRDLDAFDAVAADKANRA